jgi:hypothetical protein
MLVDGFGLLGGFRAVEMGGSRVEFAAVHRVFLLRPDVIYLQ